MRLEGKTLCEVVPPDVCERMEPVYRAAAEGRAAVVELPFAGRTYRLHGVPVRGEAARVAGMAIVQDVTDIRQAEADLQHMNRALRVIGEVIRAVAASPDEVVLARAACETIVGAGGHRMAWVGYAEEDADRTVRPVVFAGVEDAYLKSIRVTWADDECGRGPTGTAIRTGRPCVVHDMAADAGYGPWRQAAAARGYRSSAAIPLIAQGCAFGALNVYSNADVFTDEEIGLLTDVASNLTLGILGVRAQAARDRAEEETRQVAAFPRLDPNPILALDLDGRVLLANPAAARAFPGLVEAGLRHPALAGWEAVAAALRQGTTSLVERDVAVADAWYHQVFFHVAELERVIVYLMDITDRKRAEEALRESEKLYRSLFENLLNGFAYCRMLFEDGKPQDFIYLAVNDAFESQTGLRNVVGRKATEVIPGIREADPRLLEIYGRVARTGRPERFEMFVEAMQMWFWVSVYSPAPEHFVAVFDVITDRKRAEEALRKSQERFTLAMEATRDGLWDWDVRSGDVYCSPNYSAMLGYAPDEFAAKYQSWLDLIHPDDRQNALRVNQDCIDGRADSFQVEFRMRTRNGDWKWIVGRGKAAARDDQGKATRLVGTHVDITDRKKAEDRLAARQRRLRSLGAKLAVAEEQERRRIAAGLHDNVVQSLMLAKLKLEGLAGKKPAARLAHPLREVRDVVEQAVRDTRTLLFELSPVALYELGIEAAIEAFLEKVHADHGIKTTFESDGHPKPLGNDVRGVLFRAVRESIQNVVKHAHARSAGVSVRREGERILVEVRDDGVGFDPEEVLSVRDAGGGFGLFDVRERLDYLGGSLTIRSEPGRGTTVVLCAPLAPEQVNGGG